jgi:hypothetical protein
MQTTIETRRSELSGDYVGELDHEMVVDKNSDPLGNIGHPSHPSSVGHPGHPGNRGARSHGYRDVFSELV